MTERTAATMRPPFPDDPAAASPGLPADAGRVNLRGRVPNLAGWWIAALFLPYLTAGLTALTVYVVVELVRHPGLGGVAGAAFLLLLALVCGLLSRTVIRMAPRYYTEQGVAVTEAGILLYQEPKRWFPGRRLHIPWEQVRRIRLESRRGGGRHSAAQYHVVLELRTALDPAGTTTWALVEPDRVTLWAKGDTQQEIAALLHSARPDLFE